MPEARWALALYEAVLRFPPQAPLPPAGGPFSSEASPPFGCIGGLISPLRRAQKQRSFYNMPTTLGAEPVDFDESDFFDALPAGEPLPTPQQPACAADQSDESDSESLSDDGLAISDCSSSDAEDAVEESLRLRLQSMQSSLGQPTPMEGGCWRPVRCAHALGLRVRPACPAQQCLTSVTPSRFKLSAVCLVQT